jgi:two-component system NtrC family sensor kinase
VVHHDEEIEGQMKENRSQQETRRDPSRPDYERTRSYFRRLRRKLQVWLLVGYALPLGLLVVSFQFQFDFHRRMIIGVAGLLVVMIITAMIVTTNRLLGQAQRVQESRRELQSQLFQASKLVAVGELAAGVAHEINNPLAIIAAGSGLVRDMLDPEIPLDYSPEEVKEELDKIDTAVYRARNITQALMKFVSRGEGTPVATDVHKILDEILDGVKMREFQVSNIEVERNYDPAMPEILLDPDQIRQVFLSLINNAGDSIDGSGKITLSTRHDDSVVEVTITDTGKGMTTEQMGKIFLPFYTTKEVGRGPGLGLSVSLSIVEAMGGRIELQSMPGRGSSFVVTFPARRPERIASEE